MFGKHAKASNAIEQAHEQITELQERVENIIRENQDLKNLRKQELHNNTILVRKNMEQQRVLKQIEIVAYQNYGRDDIALSRIRELISDWQSGKISSTHQICIHSKIITHLL